MTEMLTKRTIDGMITHFNEVVSEMDIPRKDKMTLLGMITAIGYETQKTANAVPVVRCRDCKWWINGMCYSDNFILRFEEVKPDWFCADGEVATVKNGDSKDSGDVIDGQSVEQG